MAWTIAEDNHLGRGFMGTILALIVIDFFCLIIRLYTRFLQRTVPDLSDYMLLIGFLMAPGSIVWYGSTAAIRVSMTLFYRQLFHPVKTFIRISSGVIALNALALLVVIVTVLTICRPMRYAAFPEGDGHCGDVRSFQSYTSASAIVLDAITVALPMPLLWNLSMTRRRKWGLSVIFGLGILICATTVLRLIISYEFYPNRPTIQAAVASFLAGLEPTLGIIIACMPFFPAFLARLRVRHGRRFFGLVSAGHGHTGSGGSHPNARVYVNSFSAASAGSGSGSGAGRGGGGTAAKAMAGGNVKVPMHSYHRRLLCQEDGGSESDVSPAYPMGAVGVAGGSREYCYSAVELGLLDEEQRGIAARPAGEQGRIYITRGFDIQSHSPKCGSGLV
ncbi:hypothetical protein BJX64DRAFT_288775 [Aspergillus heterothallicus]